MIPDQVSPFVADTVFAIAELQMQAIAFDLKLIRVGSAYAQTYGHVRVLQVRASETTAQVSIAAGNQNVFSVHGRLPGIQVRPVLRAGSKVVEERKDPTLDSESDTPRKRVLTVPGHLKCLAE